MNLNVILLIKILFYLFYFCDSISLSIYEQKKYAKQLESKGLYDEHDQVTDLDYDSIYGRIYKQKYASIVEFYNAYCGHCRRFAPVWKSFAADAQLWKDIVFVGAIDCANNENNGVCREFEVLSYPTIKYFSPNLEKIDASQNVTNLGVILEIETETVGDIKVKLFEQLLNESTSNTPNHWPNLHPINMETLSDTSNNHIYRLFDNYPDTVQYLFLLNDKLTSTTGMDITLDLHVVSEIGVRYVNDVDVAEKLQINRQKPSLSVIDRKNLNITPISILHDNNTRNEVYEAIKDILLKHEISQTSRNFLKRHDTDLIVLESSSAIPDIIELMNRRQDEAILKEVKTMPGVVFQADLEVALRYTLFHEIPMYSEISDERMMALRRYISVLKKYAPLGDNGKSFLKEVEVYVMENEQLDGKVFEGVLLDMEKRWTKVFSSNRYVGCQSSVVGLRGFTCGLWLLFHYLTVQSAELEQPSDPLEILQAMHGYVKYFFGCTECSQHFQLMATRNKIWNVLSKDDAILWLWSAHNEVNRRLAGDKSSEDPEFPKIQFPSKTLCDKCWRDQTSSLNHHLNSSEWDKSEVLNILKRIYSNQYLSRFGVSDESILPQSLGASGAKSLHGKRISGSIFSDLDMRMGVLLYVFCIGMMIIAAKLFLRRGGYRKKNYSYDIWSKV